MSAVDPNRVPGASEEERDRRADDQEAAKHDPHNAWSPWPHRGREGHYDDPDLLWDR